MDDFADLVPAIFREAHLHNRCRTFLGGIEAVWIVTVEQNHALGWHNVQHSAETGLDLVEVAVDVCMVELDVVHDDEFRQVVDEFRTLVEEGCVVFVAFDDEILRVPQTGSLSEIRRDATNEVAGFESSGFKNPRQNRGGRRFAMGAGHNQIVPPAENEMPQRLGHREVEQLAVQNGLHSGIAARHGVPDHDQIRRWDVIRLEAFCDGDALGFQKSGHRRIDIVVLAGDFEALVFHRGRDGSHRCAADAQKVHMLRGVVHF